MTPGPDPPLDHARAETYLRLLAEAELRRVEALPRPDPLAAIGVPAPLRGAVRLALPLGQRAVSALRPLTDSAARTLQPLAENAAQTLQPVAENAAQTLQPLTNSAARTLQPLAGQLAGAVLPAAEQAARRLHPLAWQAAGQLQTLQNSGMHQLRMWRSRARQATAPLRRATAGGPAQPEEPSAEEAVRRLGTVGNALVWVGALDEGTADSVVGGLETALVARSRIPPHHLWFRMRRGPRQQQANRPLAGAYAAAPVGVLVPAAPESGLGDIHMVTMVIAPDRAFLVTAGRVADPDSRSLHRDPWPVFGGTGLQAATDDRGNGYELREDSAWSDGDGEWGGTLRLSPIPPAGTQWLELTMSPGSAPVRVDLAGACAEAAPESVPAGSPAEHLIDAAAIGLLDRAIGAEGDRVPWHDLRQVADVVTALEAVGALAAARDAVGRLVTLAGRLGADIPPALTAAGPPRDLPAAWASILANRGRRDGPRGVAPVAVVLPELDGTRFVLAGLRSDPAGARLQVHAWGYHRMPGPFQDRRVRPWSWSARDDKGRWHILTEDSGSFSDQHAELQLTLEPPLHPAATSLEVHLAGPSGQVTVTMPLDWREPP